MLRAVLLVIPLAWESACAVGNVGTLAAKVEQSDGAYGVDVHSIGLYLRTRADDPGFNFGYSRRVYVVAGSAPIDSGWYFGKIPLPEEDSFAQDLLAVGLDVSTADPSGGIVVGYQRTQLFARVPSQDSVYLEYGSDGRVIRLHRCKGGEECDIYDY